MKRIIVKRHRRRKLDGGYITIKKHTRTVEGSANILISKGKTSSKPSADEVGVIHKKYTDHETSLDDIVRESNDKDQAIQHIRSYVEDITGARPSYAGAKMYVDKWYPNYPKVHDYE